MKDVSKLISSRATRFIPVDMKDRLKTVFNRGTGKPARAPAEEDVPDYSAIFNANRSPNQKKVRFNGPLEPPQLSAPPQKKALADRRPEHDIEEAEIVSDPAEPAVEEWEQNETALSQPAAGAGTELGREPNWKPRVEQPKVTPAAEPAGRLRAHLDEQVSHTREAEAQPLEERKAEARKPAPKPQSKSETKIEESRPNARFDPGFEGRMSETAHLKVERRAERRRTEESRVEQAYAEEAQPGMASSGYYHASEPVGRDFETSATTARDSEEHRAAAFSYESKPLEQPRDTYRTAAGQSAPRRTESPERNLHQEKESSMQAKGQESIHENGQTAVRTDSANVASIAIERNSKFSGQLKFSGTIAVDGQVEGEIVAERIVVHEGGVVNATVEGNSVVIAGTVKGDVYARGELEILASGIVHGSVTTPQISVRRGGRIEGRCAIGAPRQ